MKELEFAIETAKQAGSIIRRGLVLGGEKRWKPDNTPVTDTDEYINRIVSEAVREKFPGYSFIAEEGDKIEGAGEYAWICDPLDGTLPFSHGIPTSVFSLTLARSGQPILAVIYDPYINRLYHAEKDKGAYLNGKIIKVSQKDSFPQGVFDIEKWDTPIHSDVGKVAGKLIYLKAKALVLHCINYGGMLVADGTLLAAIGFGNFAFDSAALKIIVEEAGGKVTDIEGRQQRWDGQINGVVASNGKLHDKLIEIIKSTR